MKIRLTEDIDQGWNDLMTGREFWVLDVPGEKGHVYIRTQADNVAHILPHQYEVLDEPEN